MAQIDIDQVHDLPYVKPSSEVKEKIFELYDTLTQYSTDKPIYKKAKKEVENIVAQAYGIDKNLYQKAQQMIIDRKLAA